ncbi:hypothetical protein U0070_012142, partial [Myodes glareolus]
VPTKKDIFNTCSVLCTHNSTPVWYTQNIECNSGEGELDTRDLEIYNTSWCISSSCERETKEGATDLKSEPMSRL